MSLRLDKAIETTGTKFKIFPQPGFLSAFREPETVIISVKPEDIKPGPADDRLYVIDAINKKPYKYPYLPPHKDDKNPPVNPDPETGHFDHLDPSSRDFKAAHMYATVRRVLDIWEDYFEKKIEWFFRLRYDRMELIPLIAWNNAHSGYGFLEFGFGSTSWGGIDQNRPYCTNFDVLAHELGHTIVFSEVGFPRNSTRTAEYSGFHEAAGDLVAIVACLHFDKVVTELLGNSSGNLFTVNEVSRVGELSKSRQIRKAFNYERMSTVSNEEHDLSEPLTGAIFDIFVEVFQKILVKNGLISQQLADASYHAPDEDIDDTEIQNEFDNAYNGKEEEFKISLLQARDYLGEILAKTFLALSPHYLTYVDVGLSLLSSDLSISGGEHQNIIRDCFSWREIDVSDEDFDLFDRKLTDCMP